MISDLAAAQTAASVYATSRRVTSSENEIAIPVNWTPVGTGSDDPSSGFLARAYTDGAQLVIAFGGTTGESESRIENFVRDWLQGSIPAAGGLILAPQVLAAAKFYLDLVSNPAYAGMPVTFTGHSLGGGLGALMAVYFDKPAVTFNAAPFLRHADSLTVATQLKVALLAAGYSLPEALAGYVAIDPTGALLPSPSRLLRDDQVRHVYVAGEALSVAPAELLSALGLVNPFVPTGKIVGTESCLDPQAQTNLGWGMIDRAFDLHSQALLTGFLASTAFLEAARSQAGLLPAVFGSELMAVRQPSGAAPRLLESLVNRQLAGQGSLDVLAQDVSIIMGSGTAGIPAVNSALYAAALGAQFVQSSLVAGQREFTALAAGVQFLSKDASDLNDARQRLVKAVASLVGTDEGGGALAALQRGEWRWTVQSGDGALAASTVDDKSDVMLGGEASDNLAGGGGADFLVGGASGDTLDGGAGNDTLIGGAGSDIYRFTGAFGHDTIEDSDGAGQIKVDDVALPAGKKLPGTENTWVTDDGAYTYVLAPTVAGGSTGILYILKSGSADTITIRNYTAGELGLTLASTPATVAPPTSTFTGEFVKAVDPGGAYLRSGFNYVPSENGTPGPQPDLFVGTAGIDFFELGASNDGAMAGDGDDRLVGGDGADLLFGGGGHDRIDGGAGRDFLYGSHPGTWTDAPTRTDSPPPVAYGPEIERGFGWVVYDGGTDGNGVKVHTVSGIDVANGTPDGGNLIDGGAGDDDIVAGNDDDLARGGADNDHLWGAAGNDMLFGEDGDDKIEGDGLVLAGYLTSTPAHLHGVDVLDGGIGDDALKGQGGADVLIGGAGDDLLWGDDGDVRLTPASVHGDDSLDGGTGNDQLVGGGGSDQLHGGGDNDLLRGDDDPAKLAGEFHGNDYLDGEGGLDELRGDGGNDTLFGGSDNDTLIGDASPAELAGPHHGRDHLDGESGDDHLEGGGRDDRLFGGGDNDMLWGDSPQPGLTGDELGDDYLDGGDGADRLVGGGKDDILFGGIGADQMRGDGVPADTDPATHGNDYLEGEVGNDLLFGDGGADVLYGGADDDQLLGDADELPAQYHGDDFLDGEDGADVLVGNGGNDTLYGGAGGDRLHGDTHDGALAASAHGDDFLDGGGEDDVMTGDGGADVLLGGSGNDQLFGDNDGAVVATPAHGADAVDGGDGNDLIVGGGAGDSLFGGIGNDQLYGDDDAARVAVSAHGADTIDGGEGNDLIAGDGGGDTLSGGNGDDTLYGDGSATRVPESAHGNDEIDAGAGADIAFGGGGNDRIDGDEGDDWLWGDDLPSDLAVPAHGADLIDGGAGSDMIEGGGGADELHGGDGNDFLIGDFAPDAGPASAHGDDVLDGGAGSDNLDAGGGHDTLTGGTGSDYLIGGAGNDTYVFHPGDGADTIDNADSSGGIDTLRFGAGIAPDDIEGSRIGDSLVLQIAGTTARVTIADWYVADSVNGSGETVTHKLDRAEFAGGTVWTTAMIEAALVTPLVLNGSAGGDVLTGGAGDDQLYGNGGNDELYGGRGADYLDGGSGGDLMLGGRGDDSYRVDSTTDRVVEELTVGGGDFDNVQASIRFVLPKGIEGLHVYALSSSDNVDGTGNVLNNTIEVSADWAWPYTYASGLAGNDAMHGGASHDTFDGGSGNDTLNGGAGEDTLRGGSGDDWYTVDNTKDVVTENAGEGYDVVESGITYQLPANVESVRLTGTAHLNATGNNLDNHVRGNDGNNVLTGGTGNDYLSGRLGSDTYMFAKGDGRDVIGNYGAGAADIDKVQFGTGIAPTDVAVERAGNGLLMSMFGGADSIFFDGWFDGDVVDTVQFSTGLTWSAAQVGAMAVTSLTNAGPQLIVPQPVAITATEGQEISFAFAPGTVVDSDPWDAPGFAFFLVPADEQTSDPSWLGLAATGTSTIIGSGPFGFVGTPNYGRAGSYEYLAQWQDMFGESVSVPVTITVLPAPPNRAPAAVGAVADIEIPEAAGSAPVGAGGALFQDPDGDPLTHAATRADGTALPQWLSILPSGSGWRAQIRVGTIEGERSIPVKIVATDDSGAQSLPLSFNVTVLVEDLVVNGTSDVDSLGGGSGNDRLYALAGNDYLWGHVGDDLLDGGSGADRMYGGPGNDTYVVDSTSDVVNESADELGDGHDAVQSSVTHTLPAEVEDLTLTGSSAINGTGNVLDNVLTGNAATNTLTGGAGNDVLDGRGGADKLIGGPGDDRYIVDAAADAVTELANEGADTVEASVTYTLASNVENLTLTGTAAINGTGNALANRITGNAAANVLSGGAGADRLIGSAGDDTYVVDNAGDEVVESAGEGIDLVQASIAWTLGAHVENLTLTGTVAINGIGNALGNLLTGNSANNVLTGGDGSDLLDGGSGNDTLIGGAGDDTYVVNATGDTVAELAGEGIDTVRSGVTWTLGEHVENLELTGTSAIGGTGNALDNLLSGNTAVNTLAGGAGNDVLDGGAGGDTLAGGAGDDLYVVDNTSDKILEGAGEGADSVRSSVTWTLSANVEHLTLIGIAAINGTGNELANEIVGNAAANVLNGGAGADILRGGNGSDTYIVDSAADSVIEAAGEGTDLVQSSVSWTLGEHVENLTLTGAAAIDGTGNELDNVLAGNSSANTLRGGAGNDTYVVNSAADAVIEFDAGGIDLVQSGVTWTLGDHIENLTLTGSAAINGTGNALANALVGNGASNTLTAGAGDDSLDGGLGNDLLVGGAGDDVYVVNVAGDVVTEQAGEGTDTVISIVAWTLGANLENLVLAGSGKINGTGNAADNRLTGNAAINTLTGGAGNDVLDGGGGADILVGGAGDDLYVLDNTSDKITENASEGTDFAQSSATWTLTANVEHLTLTGGSAINGTGNTLANHLRGNAGNNVLNGGGGNDVVQGAAGNDTVADTLGNNVLDGGDGNDALTGGTGREFLSGGAGGDTFTLGGGADLIAFNRGHGADAVNAPTGTSNGLNETNDTVSLGGTRYADLLLARSANDLFIKVAGTADSLKFGNWYAVAGNRTVTTLQVIVDSTADYDAGSADPLLKDRVAWFDFTSLVNAFNAASAANPALGDWAVPAAALNAALRGGSSTHAFGGDLAYGYGRDGNLAALDFATATTLLADANYAVAPQPFGAAPAPGGIRLSSESPNIGIDPPGAEAQEAPASPELDSTASPRDLAVSADEPMLSADGGTGETIPSMKPLAAGVDRDGGLSASPHVEQIAISTTRDTSAAATDFQAEGPPVLDGDRAMFEADIGLALPALIGLGTGGEVLGLAVLL